jgi:hypothetical protein
VIVVKTGRTDGSSRVWDNSLPNAAESFLKVKHIFLTRDYP